MTAILTMLALQLIGAGPWPIWARAWRNALPAQAWPGRGKALTLAELGQAGLFQVYRDDGTLLPPPAAKPAGSQGLLGEIFGSVRATEQAQHGIVLVEWAAYLEELAASRLAVARLAWEERFRDVSLRLGEENDLLLTEYAAEVRREYFPAVSAIEMQITMGDDPAKRPALEAQLAEVLLLADRKIAQRREDLSRQCALELENLRNQAQQALADLTASLGEEIRRTLAMFKARQDKDHADWLVQNVLAEASAREAWIFQGLPGLPEAGPHRP